MCIMMAFCNHINVQNLRMVCHFAESSFHCFIQNDLCRFSKFLKLYTGNSRTLYSLRFDNTPEQNKLASEIYFSTDIKKHLCTHTISCARSSVPRISGDCKILKHYFFQLSNNYASESKLMDNIDSEKCCQRLEANGIKDSTDESKISILPDCEMLNFDIIKVKNGRDSFEKFMHEWKIKEKFSLSITTSRVSKLLHFKKHTDSKTGILSNLDLADRIHKLQIQNDNLCITGFFVSWNRNNIFYVPLFPELVEDEQNSEETLTFETKLNALKDFLENGLDKKTIITSNLQKLYKTLCLGCGITLDITSHTKFKDPRVAYWLLHPEQGERGVDDLIYVYFPELTPYIQENQKYLDEKYADDLISAKSITDIIFSSLLMDKLQNELAEQQMEEVFIDKEMPLVLTVSKMELNGIGFDTDEAVSCHKCLKREIIKLKKQAFAAAGSQFALKYQDEVEMVIEKNCGISTHGSNLTFNELLIQLSNTNPLVATILDWRKVSSALKLKLLVTSLKQKAFNPAFSMDRLYGNYNVFSPHGLVTISEPNLQMIPRNFVIYSNNSNKSNQKPVSISLRSCFIPMNGGVILTADYSQFGIRMLAHLSKDKQLIDMLNKDKDIFRYVASQWKQISEDSVSDQLRLKTKQACFVMMYSSDPVASMKKVISNQHEANHLWEMFQNLYPGMNQYLSSVLEDCRQYGYIRTISGRKRHFPFINIEDDNFRRNAERQTFSSLIQGSCSDLFKNALVNIDKNLALTYPRTKVPLKIQGGKSLSSADEPLLERGAYLVNQIHDELVLEVAEENLSNVIPIVKKGLEESMELSVKLTSRLKIGKTWGNLKEVT